MAIVFLLVGFVTAIVGLALWSVPAALVVAGLVVFVSGGLDLRRQRKGSR